MFGHLVDAPFGLGVEQLLCTFHPYLHDKSHGCLSHQSGYFAMKLTRTQTKFVGQRIHVQLLLVHQQIDGIDRFGEETVVGIGVLHFGLLAFGQRLRELFAQEATLLKQFPDAHTQFVAIERFSEIGIRPGL